MESNTHVGSWFHDMMKHYFWLLDVKHVLHEINVQYFSFFINAQDFNFWKFWNPNLHTEMVITLILLFVATSFILYTSLCYTLHVSFDSVSISIGRHVGVEVEQNLSDVPIYMHEDECCYVRYFSSDTIYQGGARFSRLPVTQSWLSGGDEVHLTPCRMLNAPGINNFH